MLQWVSSWILYIIGCKGGDHTFLRASALIWDRKVPILGVNTYPAMFEGALNNHSIKYENREIETEAMLEAMEDDLSV